MRPFATENDQRTVPVAEQVSSNISGLSQRGEIIQTGARVSTAGAALFLVNDCFDGSEVHWRPADSRHLRRDTRPMEESRTITREAGPRRGALSITIGGQGISLYKLACVIPTKPS